MRRWGEARANEGEARVNEGEARVKRGRTGVKRGREGVADWESRLLGGGGRAVRERRWSTAAWKAAFPVS